MEHNAELRTLVDELMEQWNQNWLGVHGEYCSTLRCTGAEPPKRKRDLCASAREYQAQVARYRQRLDELLSRAEIL